VVPLDRHCYKTRGKIISMSEIVVNMSGAGQYRLDLNIADPGIEDDDIEVWRAIFTDQDGGASWEVYFEMGTDYEIWDLIDMAITSYRESVEELD